MACMHCCRWHPCVVGCPLHTLQAKLFIGWCSYALITYSRISLFRHCHEQEVFVMICAGYLRMFVSNTSYLAINLKPKYFLSFLEWNRKNLKKMFRGPQDLVEHFFRGPQDLVAHFFRSSRPRSAFFRGHQDLVAHFLTNDEMKKDWWSELNFSLLKPTRGR